MLMCSTEWLLMEHLHLSSPHLGDANGDDDGDHDDADQDDVGDDDDGGHDDGDQDQNLVSYSEFVWVLFCDASIARHTVSITWAARVDLNLPSFLLKSTT